MRALTPRCKNSHQKAVFRTSRLAQTPFARAGSHKKRRSRTSFLHFIYIKSECSKSTPGAQNRPQELKIDPWRGSAPGAPKLSPGGPQELKIDPWRGPAKRRPHEGSSCDLPVQHQISVALRWISGVQVMFRFRSTLNPKLLEKGLNGWVGQCAHVRSTPHLYYSIERCGVQIKKRTP